MDKISIKPIQEIDCDCSEHSIITILSWLGYDYRMIFSKHWNFIFTPESSKNNIVGDQIFNKNIDLEDYVADLFGISFKKIICKKNEAISIIKEELNKSMPLIAGIDPFWYPLDNNYQVRHSNHIIIITGIDIEKQELLCIDPYLTKEEVTYSIENFEKSMYFLARVDKEHRVKEVNNSKFISDSIRSIVNENEVNFFDSMRGFADYIETDMDIEAEIPDIHNMDYAPIIQTLNRVALSRTIFSKYLAYVADNSIQSGSIEALAADVQKAREKWRVVRTYIAKARVVDEHQLFLKKVSKKVREIADFEENILEELKNILLMNIDMTMDLGDFSSNSDEKGILPDDTESSQTIFVDISNYLNNQGMDKVYNEKSKANIDYAGLYFLVEEDFDKNLWNVDGCVYKLQPINEEKNDNISCEGQKISVEENRYSNIMLLTCSLWNEFDEEVIFEYQDGSIEKKVLFFPNHSVPKEELSIAWKGKSVKRSKGNTFIHRKVPHIYSITNTLSTEKVLKSIILPDNPNIRIFAISLGLC